MKSPRLLPLLAVLASLVIGQGSPRVLAQVRSPLPSKPVITFIPHLATGGGFASQIFITNLGNSNNNVVINRIRQSGVLSSTQSQLLAPAGTMVVSTGEGIRFASISTITFQWVAIGSDAPVLATVLFDFRTLNTLASQRLSAVGVPAAAALASFRVPFVFQVQNSSQPLLAEGFALANPQGTTTSVTLILRDDQGIQRGGADTITLNPYAQTAFTLTDLPNIGAQMASRSNFVGSVEVRGSQPVVPIITGNLGGKLFSLPVGVLGAASSVVPSDSPASETLPPLPRLLAQVASPLPTKVNLTIIPYVVSGGESSGGYVTRVFMINLSDNSNSLMVNRVATDGTLIESRLQSLNPGGTLVITTGETNRFLPLHTEWMAIGSDAPLVASAMFDFRFATSFAWEEVNAVGVPSSSAQTSLLLPFIYQAENGNQPSLAEGFALANRGDATAQVTLRLLDSTGAFTNAADSISIPPYGQTGAVLSNLPNIAQRVAGQVSFLGALQVTATQPVAPVIAGNLGGLLFSLPIAGGVSFAGGGGGGGGGGGFTLTVTLPGTGSGNVISTPSGINCPPTCTATFPSGTSVSLSVLISVGSTFSGFAGACSGTITGPPCTITMDANKSVAATFTLNTGGGIVPLLANAFNFPGPYPMPGPVTYTNKAGQTITSYAYPGQIFLVVSPTAVDITAATSLIRANNGTVIAQIPSSGLYWVQVAFGTEAAFIAAVQNNPAVTFVGPNVPLTGSQNAPVNLSCANLVLPLLPPAGGLMAQFDLFASPASGGANVCGLSHGEAVDGIIIQHGNTKAEYDVSQLTGQCTNPAPPDRTFASLAAGSDIGFGVERSAQGAFQRGQKHIVNVSLQAGGQPNDMRDRSMCETNPTAYVDGRCSCATDRTPPPACAWNQNPNGNYASWKSDEFAILVGIASTLEFMPDQLRDNTLVVISAGNSGLDLTNEISLLRTFLPRAFSHLIIAGCTDPNGHPFPGCNHSRAPTDMLYAPGVNVTIPGTGGCQANGSSFAAPAITDLATRVAASPQGATLTTSQLVRAIMTAGQTQAVDGLPTLPTPDQVAAVIQSPPLAFNAPANLPAATVGVAYPSYSFCDPRPASLTALCGEFPPTRNPSGGRPPYHFQLDSGVGFPPFGISLNLNGILAGTPTASGTSTFRVCAVDLVAAQVCQTVTLTVNANTGGGGGAAGLAGTYTGTFSGSTTARFLTCTWQHTVSGSGTVTVAGSGTQSDPYTATFTVTGRDVITVLPGSSPQCSGSIVPANLSGPASVSVDGTTVSAHVSSDIGTVDFVGTFSGNLILGTLTINNPVFDRPIVGPLTLTRR